MNKVCMAATGIALTVAGSTALAQERKDWQATLELGAVATTGNTESLSVQGAADVRHEMENWRNEYVASVLFKDDQIRLPDGVTTSQRTAERYFFSAKSAYKLAREDSELFVFASHTEDEFAAFEAYTTGSVGYGGRWLDREEMYLDYEIGPGYFRGERALDDGTIEIEQGFIVRGAAEFQWQFTENAKFAQTISVETGSDNTRTMADTSITTKVSETLQLKAGYSVFHNTNSSPDREAADTTTSLNLVYNLN